MSGTLGIAPPRTQTEEKILSVSGLNLRVLRGRSPNAQKSYDNAQYILNPVKTRAGRMAGGSGQSRAAALVPGVRPSNGERAPGRSARRAIIVKLWLFFAGGAGLLGACSCFEDTLLAIALIRDPHAQTPAGTAEPQPAFAPIASLVTEAIGRHELPGVVVLVGRGDRVLYHAALGHRAVLPAIEPMSEDTIFDVASLTKVVATTTSVMQLIEQGRIRLNDTVAHYVPDFGRRGKDRITIRHLLTHTSGLRPDLDLEVEFSGADEAIRRAIEETPTAPPGEQFVYSDINFFLLGDIVRRVSGERLDRYAKTHVFDPLAMRETAFLPPDSWRPRIAPTEACRPLAWPCGTPGAAFLRGVVHDPTARRMDGVAGHAGLFSTAADLSRFCRMLLGGGRLGGTRILAPATVARMT